MHYTHLNKNAGRETSPHPETPFLSKPHFVNVESTFFHILTAAFPHSYHFKTFMLTEAPTAERKHLKTPSTTHITEYKTGHTVHTFQHVLEYEK